MQRIALAKGDGIGPEITDAVLDIFAAADVPLTFEPVEMGRSIFERGFSAGMTSEAKQTIEQLGILFKGPMETPKGKGVKSINVTARKVWSTYANKRVFRSIRGVSTPFSAAGIPINLTIVRENIEDTYGGIEHFLTHDVALCRRFITRRGAEQVHRYAFEMALRNGISKVTCGHKANIMKLTDGLFLEVFYEVAKEFPALSVDDVIVDDLAMKLVRRPDQFQVIVLPNLQGDIISDLCAGLVGGLGFAPSANIGDAVSIFEAVHGTAPDIAGKGIANPTALLMSGLMMLRHIGLLGKAALIENALMMTLEQGVRTADFGSSDSKPSSTREFTACIIRNFGQQPTIGGVSGSDRMIEYRPSQPTEHRMLTSGLKRHEVVGIDVFVESEKQPTELALEVQRLVPPTHVVRMISNRGTQVWPEGSFYTDCVNQYRIRIESACEKAFTERDMLAVAISIAEQVRVCSTEMLMKYDGTPSYSRAQGE
jgi:isocitrate dehydrogenase